MELFTNRSFLISLIALIALVFIMSFLFGLINQLDVYASTYPSTFNYEYAYFFEPFYYLDETTDIYNDLSNNLNRPIYFFSPNNTDYLYFKYDSDSQIGGWRKYNQSGDLLGSSNNRYYTITGSIDLSNDIIDVPTEFAVNYGFIEAYYLNTNETLEVINNYDSINLENDMTFTVDGGTNTGYIELYKQDDLMNPYKIIPAANLSNNYVQLGEITIDLKSDSYTANEHVFIKNNSQLQLSYLDGTDEKIEAVEKSDSYHYINVGNVTMIDFTKSDKEDFLLDAVGNNNALLKMEWLSEDLQGNIEFGETDSISLRLYDDKKYYLRFLNTDSGNNTYAQFNCPVSPEPPDNPVLESTFEDYFTISNPDGSSESESIEKVYVDLNRYQDKLIYRNLSDGTIDVGINVMDNYTGEIIAQIQEQNTEWNPEANTFEQDWFVVDRIILDKEHTVPIESGQRIVVAVQDGTAKFMYPIEKYVGYEISPYVLNEDYEISVYYEAFTNENMYDDTITSGSIIVDDDFDFNSDDVNPDTGYPYESDNNFENTYDDDEPLINIGGGDDSGLPSLSEAWSSTKGLVEQSLGFFTIFTSVINAFPSPFPAMIYAVSTIIPISIVVKFFL